MILIFDKFERYELPQVTLCNPNSRATEVDGKITITDTVGVLSNPKGMNLKLNFNAPHELSFDYYSHKSNDPIKQSFYDSIYEAIQTDRYIYLTDIGYFIISGVTDSDEDNIDKKSISLKSCEENELATAEGLYLKEGTYYLHTEDNKGLIDLFLPKTAGWTVGYIDPSLLIKPYFVEETEVDNGYNFLYTTIQDMFECIVEPDIIKRTISVYSRAYYAEHHLTDIHIAKYNLLKHKTVEENDEDKYTALNVQGKDESLEIRIVNPTGKNVIYNFESRYSWMSPSLQDAVERWQEKCESVEGEYLTLQQGYYNDMQNIVFPLEQDIKVLELQLKQQQQTRDLIVIGEQDKAIKVVEILPVIGKSNILYFVITTTNSYEEYIWEHKSWKYIDLIQVDDISDTNQQRALDLVNAAINNTNTKLATTQSKLNDEKNNIETNYSQPISNINKDCALETTSIFSTELRNELMTHIKPTDYVDEYMLVTESMTYPQRFEKAKELMDRAQSQLVKISSGQKTYSIDTRSFLFNKQFKHFSEQLCAGAIIYVETKNDTMEQLHLTGIDISFDDKSTNFTLGNKYDRSDLKALYEDALGQNSKSFNELKYITSIIEDQQKQLDYQRNWVADLRTLTLDNVLTSEDQAIEINNRGLIGRKRQLNEDGSWKFDDNGNPLFELEQVKLINNTLVFTENNWQTASTAVGKIAVGYDAEGNVKYAYGINGQVLIGELILGNNLVLTGTGAGIKIKDINGNDAFYADDDGNLVLSGKVFAQSGEIGGWNINSTDIYKQNSNGYAMALASNQVGTQNRCFAIGKFVPAADNWGTDVYFSITGQGKLKATGATIDGNSSFNGKITASEGKIGGWNIKSDYLGTEWDDNGKYPIFLSQGKSAYVSILQENKDCVFYTRGKFVVDTDGNLYANSGQIGGWNLNPTAYDDNGAVTRNAYIGRFASDGGTTGTLFISQQGVNGYVSAAKASKKCVIYSNGKFAVDIDGNLYATNANITGTINATSGVFERDIKIGNRSISNWITNGGYINEIKATTGTVGGWSITSNMIYWHDPNKIESGIELGYNTITVPLSDGTVPYGNQTNWIGIVGAGYQYNQGSDKNVKNSIEEFSFEYDKLFDALKPCRFKYNYENNNIYHSGFIAQEMHEAIICAGLNNKDFAAYMELTAPLANGSKYRVQKDEIVALNTWQIQKLKLRVAELENTVIELKTQIQTLTAG